MKKVDFDRYRNECLQMRSEYIFDAFGGALLRPRARNRARTALAALLLAMAASLAGMLALAPHEHDGSLENRVQKQTPITALADEI